MYEALEKGLVQGIAAAGLGYLVVQFMGISKTSFSVLLYMFLIFGAFFELKNSLDLGPADLLGEVVVVAEEEEKTLKRVFRDKKYRVKGELEEVQ